MTWSQAVFGYSGVVLSATSAVLSGFQADRRGGSILVALICGGGSVLATLIVMSAVAIALFPGYPLTPVPELDGVLLTVPCVIAGACALRFAGGWNTGPKRPLRRACLILTASWFVGVFLSYEFTVWRYRKALPWTASEIREYVWTEGFLPDYKYFLRAAISEQQFEDYVSKFELTSTKAMGLCQDDRATWFQPPRDAHNVYELTQGNWSMSALYDGGHIYVTVTLQ